MNRLFYLYMLVYATLISYGRILVMGESKNLSELTIPLILDFSFALFIIIIALLLKKFSKFLTFTFLFAFSLFHIANMEYIVALNNVINLSDLHYLGDGEFIKGTLSHINFPIYTLLLIVFVILVLFLPKKKISVNRNEYMILIFGCVCLLIINVQLTSSQSNWKAGNFIYLSLYNSYKSYNKNNNNYTYDEKTKSELRKEIFGETKVSDGNLLIDNTRSSLSNKRNILMVVMEGIPGAYLEQNQKLIGLETKSKLESFNKIINHSIIVPNFLTHNNQTIRGLYSILSGDYPKLTGSTPKAYEYMQLSEEERAAILPKKLQELGYNTAFIQAAPLEFMSKDQFMKAAGFNQVIGSDSFSYQHVPFGWGIDDKAFFEQSQKMIQELNTKNEPWFVTMLTVGTHHPFAVPDELAKQYSDRKQASIAYLDSALNDFIDYLNDSGITKDTLVLFISDESHGVDNLVLGSNWGICLAYLPEINNTIVNNDVFGHIDLLPSVLDYLEPSMADNLQGRSIFRDYAEERPMLFANHARGDLYYSTQKGILYQLNNSDDLFSIESSNGEMFSSNYTIENISDEEIVNKMKMFQDFSDKSLSTDQENKKFSIVENRTFSLKNNESNLITNGQYIDIPAGSLVSLEFDYEIKGNNTNLYNRFILEKPDGDKVISKEIDQKQGTMYYRFYTSGQLGSYSFGLSVVPYADVDNKENIEMTIRNLSISYSKDDRPDSTIYTNFVESDKSEVLAIRNLIPHMGSNQLGVRRVNGEYLLENAKENVTLIYGPYLNYPKGNYVLRYQIQPSSEDVSFNLDIATDLGANIISKKSYTLKDLKKEGDLFIAELPFELDGETNLEFRLQSSNNKLNMVVKNISVEVTK